MEAIFLIKALINAESLLAKDDIEKSDRNKIKTIFFM